MKTMVIVLTLAALVTGIGATAATAEDLDDFYRDYLAEKTDLCAGKGCFLDSRSQVLRQYAETSLAKAQFLRDHREQLVDKMIEGDVGRRPHRIDCFLILEFKAAMPPA